MATTSSDPLQPYEALLLRETRSPVDAADPTAVSSLRAAAGSPDAMPRRRLAAAASGGGADLHSKQVQHELRVVDRVRIERRREHDKALDLCECRGVTACVATLDKDRAALAFVGQPVMHELWFNRCVEPDETRTAATSRATNSNANEQNSARAADGCSCNTAPVDDEVSVNANGEDSQGKNSSDTGIKSKQTRGASTAAANEQKESLILVSDHDLPALVRGLCTGLGGLLAVALSDETIRVFSRSTIYAVTNEEGTRHDPTDPNKESLSELTCLFPLGGPSSPFHAVALVATEDKRGIFVLTRHERGIRTGGPYNLDAATSIDLLEIRESNALRLANSDSANDTDSTKKLQARAKTKEELVEDLDVPTFTLPRRLLYAERALELQAAMLLPRAGRYGADLVAAFDGKTRSLRFFQIV